MDDNDKVEAIVVDGKFKIMYIEDNGEHDGESLGNINNNANMNEIIDQCRSLTNNFNNDYPSDDAEIIAKLFANTPDVDESNTAYVILESGTQPKNDDGTLIYILSDYEKTKVEINPYKYVTLIDNYFSGDYKTKLEDVAGPPEYTIPWLFQFAKKYHITNLETHSDLLSNWNRTLSSENKKNEDLLDIANRVEEHSKHRLQTRNRLSFINKDQIERMLFKNDFIRRTLFYLCLIIFVAFLSQFGFSIFMTNALCFILFVTWAIHSFIMYNTFNTRHNLQFRMKVYSGDVGDISKNNIKYKNVDRCSNDNDDNDDNDKPRGKC